MDEPQMEPDLVPTSARVTRRLTVWQGSTQPGWKILFYQGTLAE
jgi:hypothetical protein